MRVFELMKQLSEMPAGAEVEFSTLMAVEELVKNEIFGCDEEVSYSVQKSIVEAEKVSENLVKLYSD